jgi:putative transposase
VLTPLLTVSFACGAARTRCVAHSLKYEPGWHVSPTVNQHDAIAAVELALAEAQGSPAARWQSWHYATPTARRAADHDRHRKRRSIPLVPVRGLHRHPPPNSRHVRTRVRTPGQNGSRERGFGTPKYEQLLHEKIDDVLDLVEHAERYRVDYNTVRPHGALSRNRPCDVHVGLADPRIPTFPSPKFCHCSTRDARSRYLGETTCSPHPRPG